MWDSSHALESCLKRSWPECSRYRRCDSGTNYPERNRCPTIDFGRKIDFVGSDSPLEYFSVFQLKRHTSQSTLKRNILNYTLLSSINPNHYYYSIPWFLTNTARPIRSFLGVWVENGFSGFPKIRSPKINMTANIKNR